MYEIWLDTETSGLIDGTHRMVQLAAIAEDGEEFNAHVIYPDVFKFSALALLINDYPSVIQKAQTDKEFLEKSAPLSVALDFLKFIGRHREKNNGYRLTPCGHNVRFDLDFLNSFYEYCNIDGVLDVFDYHHIDTMHLANTYKSKGRIPKQQSLSLVNLCKYFGIEIGEAHVALNDIRATRKLHDVLWDYKEKK